MQNESSENNEHSAVVETPKRSRALRTQIMLGVALICVPVSALMIFQSSNSPAEKPISQNSPPVKKQIAQNKPAKLTKQEQLDIEYREKCIGVWEREESGKRILTINDDGTSTLVYYPTGINGWLLAKKVTMQIEWKIENGKVEFHSLSGLPKASFDMITAKHGRHRVRKILEISDNHFKLFDEKEKKDEAESKWTRVVKDETK